MPSTGPSARRKRPAELQVADHDDDEHGDDERQRQHADGPPDDRRGGVAVGDGDHALAVGARSSQSGCSSTRSCAKRTDEDERVGADHEQQVPPSLEPPGREPEQQTGRTRPAPGCSRARRRVKTQSSFERGQARRGTRGTRPRRGGARSGSQAGATSASTPETRNERPTVSASERNAPLLSCVVAREDERRFRRLRATSRPRRARTSERRSHPSRSDSAVPAQAHPWR